MTIPERADAYAKSFPDRPPLQVVTEGAGSQKHDVIYGQFVIGNDYTNKTTYYGAYPHGYLERIAALFPDVDAGTSLDEPLLACPDGRIVRPILQVFSGSLPPGDYVRVDCNPELKPDIVSSVYDIAEAMRPWRPFPLVLADPPYTAADANRYKTPMIDRGRAFRALAEVTRIGGHVVWLDCCWPMHRKDQWRTVGRIGLTRSTNHRVRMVSIFERVAA